MCLLLPWRMFPRLRSCVYCSCNHTPLQMQKLQMQKRKRGWKNVDGRLPRSRASNHSAQGRNIHQTHHSLFSSVRPVSADRRRQTSSGSRQGSGLPLAHILVQMQQYQRETPHTMQLNVFSTRTGIHSKLADTNSSNRTMRPATAATARPLSALYNANVAGDDKVSCAMCCMLPCAPSCCLTLTLGFGISCSNPISRARCWCQRPWLQAGAPWWTTPHLPEAPQQPQHPQAPWTAAQPRPSPHGLLQPPSSLSRPHCRCPHSPWQAAARRRALLPGCCRCHLMQTCTASGPQ